MKVKVTVYRNYRNLNKNYTYTYRFQYGDKDRGRNVSGLKKKWYPSREFLDIHMWHWKGYDEAYGLKAIKTYTYETKE